MYRQLNLQEPKVRNSIFFTLLAALLTTLLFSITVLAAEEATTADATAENIESSEPDTQAGNSDQDSEVVEESDDTFIPSVQISEDLSVAFPVNI